MKSAIKKALENIYGKPVMKQNNTWKTAAEKEAQSSEVLKVSCEKRNRSTTLRNGEASSETAVQEKIEMQLRQLAVELSQASNHFLKASDIIFEITNEIKKHKEKNK